MEATDNPPDLGLFIKTVDYTIFGGMSLNQLWYFCIENKPASRSLILLLIHLLVSLINKNRAEFHNS
jgi:hypothetical protein